MPYQYRARDARGNLIEGQLEASSAEAAGQQLRQDGFQVLDINDAEDNASLFPRRVGKQEIIYLTSQLAIMSETGINLSTALNGISQQEDNPTLRKVLTDLRASVESGEDFSTALARYPKLFDKTYVSLVRASEATGKLGEMLEAIATYLRKELESRGKVRAALAYPSVMLAMAIAVTIFLLTFVLPKFTPLFNSRGMRLPTPTLIMMALSHYLIDYWFLWMIGAGTAIVGFFWGRRTRPGRKMLDWVKISLPIIGPMCRKVTISRSIRTLGTMITSGVPMLEAIQLSSDVAGNYYYEQLWQDVLAAVTSGNQICTALARNALFPKMLVQMISSGEETGKLDLVLMKVSNYYDREVETSLKAVTSLIEPIMITIMGVVVGGIGMALMLPIFSLSKAVG
ncbi:MAG: type II secretion system F family protein [Planctomycetia bacterium]|nr:type II secretion system F family protein [Planctomycetia bacterium]